MHIKNRTFSNVILLRKAELSLIFSKFNFAGAMSKYFMYAMACSAVNHQYALVLVQKNLMVHLVFHL